MLLPELSNSARVWLYLADRELSPAEREALVERMRTFTNQWKAHGAALSAGAEVVFHRLLVIAADETNATASGCSIDASVNAIKTVGQQLGVDFFNRSLVPYGDTEQPTVVPMHEFWAMRKAKLIDDDTLVLNSTASTLGALRETLFLPFSESWHAEMWR